MVIACFHIWCAVFVYLLGSILAIFSGESERERVVYCSSDV